MVKGSKTTRIDQRWKEMLDEIITRTSNKAF